MKTLKYIIVFAIGCMLHVSLHAQNFDLQIKNFRLSNNLKSVVINSADSMEFDLVNAGTDSFMLTGGATAMRFNIHVDTNVIQPTPFSYQLSVQDSLLLNCPAIINAGDSVHFAFGITISPIVFTLFKDNEIVIWPILQPTEPNQNNNSARLVVHCNQFANRNNLNQKIDISISPNPTNDVLNIELPDASSKYEIEVLDITGKLMITKMQYNSGLATIHLSNYLKADGVYFVKIKSVDGVITKKINFQSTK